MILRRRGDYARVLAELGGELFATEHPMDRWFPKQWDNPHPGINVARENFVAWLDREIAMTNYFLIDLERVRSRVEQHIRTARDREFAALRRANIRQRFPQFNTFSTARR